MTDTSQGPDWWPAPGGNRVWLATRLLANPAHAVGHSGDEQGSSGSFRGTGGLLGNLVGDN